MYLQAGIDGAFSSEIGRHTMPGHAEAAPEPGSLVPIANFQFLEFPATLH
jgi:hypothetical protein